MDALIILLLFVGVGGWLFKRFAQKASIKTSRKSYGILTVIVVLGVLLLYANGQSP